MYRILACLTTQHDYRLLLLAILVCVAESFVALYVYGQVCQRRGGFSAAWLAVAGVCTGGAIWATHFIAMLAYDSGLPVSYEPVPTTISLLIAIAMTTIGLALSNVGRGRLAVAAGGGVIGVGTAAMHFTGMTALAIGASLEWDHGLVIVAIGLGVLFSMAAMLTFHARHGLMSLLAGSALLALGIATLHFIAMAAVTVVPDPTIVVSGSSLDKPTLALFIAMVTMMALSGGFAAIHLENRAAVVTVHAIEELSNMSTDAVVIAMDGVIVDANRRTVELWGGSRADLLGRKVFGDLLIGDRQCDEDSVIAFETGLKTVDGSVVPVEILRQPVHAAPHGNESYAIADLRPMIKTTDRLMRMNEELQAREVELRMQNLRFDTALAHMTQGLCMFDHKHRIVVCNRRYGELYGLKLEQLKPGTSLFDIIEMRIAAGFYAGESPDAYRQERIASVQQDLDMIQQLNDGRFISISLRMMPGGGYVSTHEDVTERRKMEDQLVHMAHHDPLTDLPNRVMLRRKLERALKGARRGDYQIAVLMLDLDRFKEVNDTLGHLAGDGLLKAVAQRLRQGMRKKAMVARFGGDEFSVVDYLYPGDDPEALPRRINELLTAPVELDGHVVSIGTTIGIAIAPRDGDDPDELLMRADHALYRAKSETRGSYRFFDAQMAAALHERRGLEHDLQQALAAGQLELHYQPLVNLDEDRITGFEALMRWNHPTRGSVPPSLFIPLAEETGLIASLTEWVLEEACREAVKWPAGQSVAVNLAVPQFKSRNLVPLVKQVLARTGLAPERLELEITETVMLNNAEAVFALFRQLRQLGVRIVLDDFGTGFSSLSYLLRFPFDKIKIDRSFISNLADGGNALVLVRSLIQMARGLGVRVTAEGIETREQLDIVRAEGCTEIQGYYISKPKPAAEIGNIRLRPLRGVPAQEAAVA